MSTRRVVAVSGGLRVPSSTRLLTDRLVEAVRSEVAGHGGEVVHETIDLREHARAVADALLTGFPTGPLRAAVEAVHDADMLIAASPTFSASYSGLFKSFFDLFEADALAGKPVLLAATGGTERHSLVLEYALRPLFTYLGGRPIRTAVYAATSDFGGEGAVALEARIARAARELADAAPGGQAPPDVFDELVPFGRLLEAEPAASESEAD
jgi:FMN reductase